MSAMRRCCLTLLLALLPGSLAAQTTADGILAIGRPAYVTASRAGSPVRLQAEALVSAIDGGHPLMHGGV